MARIDRRSQAEFAIPSLLLMEDAGVKAWSTLVTRLCRGRARRRDPWSSWPARETTAVTRSSWPGGHSAAASTGFRSCSRQDGRPRRAIPGRMLAMCEAHGHGVPGMACPAAGSPWRASRRRPGYSTASRARDSRARCALRLPISWKRSTSPPGTRVAIDVPSGVGDSFDPAAIPRSGLGHPDDGAPEAVPVPSPGPGPVRQDLRRAGRISDRARGGPLDPRGDPVAHGMARDRTADPRRHAQEPARSPGGIRRRAGHHGGGVALLQRRGAKQGRAGEPVSRAATPIRSRPRSRHR